MDEMISFLKKIYEKIAKSVNSKFILKINVASKKYWAIGVNECCMASMEIQLLGV